MRLAEPATNRKRVIGLTPLIDVVFILLVFFMLVTSFDAREARPIRLSTTTQDTQASASATVLRIEVRSNGTRWLDGRMLTDAGLLETLRTSGATAIVIVPEDGTPVQAIVSVMDSARTAGIDNVMLADDPRRSTD